MNSSKSRKRSRRRRRRKNLRRCVKSKSIRRNKDKQTMVIQTIAYCQGYSRLSLSTVWYQIYIVYCLLSTVYCLWSIVFCLIIKLNIHCLLFTLTVYCLPSTVYCLISNIYCLLCHIKYPLSNVTLCQPPISPMHTRPPLLPLPGGYLCIGEMNSLTRFTRTTEITDITGINTVRTQLYYHSLSLRQR